MTIRVQSDISQAVTGAYGAREGNEVVRDVAQISEVSRAYTGQDNVAGLDFSDDLQTSVRDLSRMGRAANDVISVLRTAESAAQEMAHTLIQMRDLAVDASGTDLSEEQRSGLQSEFVQLQGEVREVAYRAQTTLTAQIEPLLNGSHSIRGDDVLTALANELNDPEWLQGDLLDLSIIPTDFGDLESHESATDAAVNLGEAIEAMTVQRENVQKTQESADKLIEVIHEQHESLTEEKLQVTTHESANARVSFVKDQIMLQPGGSMLSQAHILPPMVFAMLR